MSVTGLKLGGKQFVVVPEKAFRNMQKRADGAAGSASGKRSRLDAADRADIELALKGLADPNEKCIPYEQVRKELGLK